MSYHPSDIVSPRVNASCCLPRVVGRLINPTIGLWQCTSCVLEGCSLDFWGQDAVQILSCQAGWGQATVGVLQVLVFLWTCPGAVNAHWVDLVVRPTRLLYAACVYTCSQHAIFCQLQVGDTVEQCSLMCHAACRVTGVLYTDWLQA
jgi:hypothetical protein